MERTESIRFGSLSDDDDLIELPPQQQPQRQQAQSSGFPIDPNTLPRLPLTGHLHLPAPIPQEPIRRPERRRNRMNPTYALPPIRTHASRISTPQAAATATTTTSNRGTPQSQGSGAATPVIDLTEEPDSPIETRAPSAASNGGRNPRRTGSRRASSPPRLSRSDGSTFVGSNVSQIPLIDLTSDSPEADYRFEYPRLRPQARDIRFHPHPGLHDELIGWDLVPVNLTGFARGLGSRLAGILGVNIEAGGRRTANFIPPSLDVSRNAFSPAMQREEPKPPMEAVAPPRQGFTRDTCAAPEEGVEHIVICPACGEELAYDPAGVPAQTSQSSGAGKKRKRAPGEHHFWALKRCGHVYCADCFENRRPTKALPEGVGFRPGSGARPWDPNELKCAVGDCNIRVAQKAEWVGIFL